MVGPDGIVETSGVHAFDVIVTFTICFAPAAPEPPEPPESLPPQATAPVAITTAMALYATGARRTCAPKILVSAFGEMDTWCGCPRATVRARSCLTGLRCGPGLVTG
ncbi:hypothetical protein; putative signal peptide [Frankia alni ACN14a]|uniref:Uncharacterized protein n=1 Tax=Frankia alni (strain DSM 45986 / CECT 9034 / ACN14a) TaxID=326424 RepID=Q0RQW1_FRAAA|nr:hypothetical protein; putative signal peptide [Frankia alni ACN14a]